MNVNKDNDIIGAEINVKFDDRRMRQEMTTRCHMTSDDVTMSGSVDSDDWVSW